MRVPHFVIVVAMTLAVAACSQPPQPTPEQAAAARKAASEAQAQEKLTMYRKLLQMHKPDLAIPIGEQIVKQYPNTAAAAEVGKQLPEMKAKATAVAEKSRLERLWLYQVGPMAGGTQSTATIDASRPAYAKVRLVLRRQTDWGTSAFLYSGGQGFVCKGQCDLVMHFDKQRHVYQGYLPEGGEPAMFIKDYKGFIKRLAKAKTLRIEVDVKGQGRQTLEFEVGGFDPAKWKAL